MMDQQLQRQSTGRIMISLVVVLLPGSIAVALQAWTANIAFGLLAAPASVAAAWLLLRHRGAGWDSVGLNAAISRKRLLITVPAATVLILVLSGALGSLLVPVLGPPDFRAFAAMRGNVGLLITWLVLVWTVAAFGEELLFRGIVLNWLYDLARPHTACWLAWSLALVATSALFGAAHAYQGATGIVLSGCIGLGFGLLYLLSRRNLWPTILTHGLYDTVGFLVLFATLNATADHPVGNGV